MPTSGRTCGGRGNCYRWFGTPTSSNSTRSWRRRTAITSSQSCAREATSWTISAARNTWMRRRPGSACDRLSPPWITYIKLAYYTGQFSKYFFYSFQIMFIHWLCFFKIQSCSKCCIWVLLHRSVLTLSFFQKLYPIIFIQWLLFYLIFPKTVPSECCEAFDKRQMNYKFSEYFKFNWFLISD